jgi:small Trp-rich protein
MVIIGVLLLIAKLAEFGPFGNWSWWIVAAPFAAAVAWWQFADSSGLTKKRKSRRWSNARWIAEKRRWKRWA